MDTTVAPVLHTADFALAWPRELFVDEARVLLYDRRALDRVGSVAPGGGFRRIGTSRCPVR